MQLHRCCVCEVDYTVLCFHNQSIVFSLSARWLRGQKRDSCRYEHWPFQCSLKSDPFQSPGKINHCRCLDVSKHLKPKLQKFNYGLSSDPYTCPQTFPSFYPTSDLSWYHLCTFHSYPSCKDWRKWQFHKELLLITPPCHKLHLYPHLQSAGKNNFSCYRFPKPFILQVHQVLRWVWYLGTYPVSYPLYLTVSSWRPESSSSL